MPKGKDTKKFDEGKKTIDIEVFRTGVLTDSEGNTETWTKEDLETICNLYNESIIEDPGKEAPLCKGHPETDDPAYGWVKKLYIEDDILKASVTLNKNFEEEVKDEQFKKVSIAIDENLLLKHIGFLGAAHPAVKGLKPVQLSEGVKIRYFADGEISSTPPETAADTLESYKNAQKEREKIYGIGIKDKIGYIQKPDAYKDLEDSAFADPVNYMYPIFDLPNLIASKETFRSWDSSYTDVERQVIIARFLTAYQGFGFDIVKDRIYFNEDNSKEKIIEDDTSTFSMPLKDSLKRDKPAQYTDYADGDFGDPVHFRFPLKTASEVKASIAIFNRENVRNQYEEKEKNYVASRILKAAKQNNIQLNQETWNFKEFVNVPADLLNKNQLVEVLKKLDNQDNNNFVKPNIRTTMKEWLIAFIQALIQKISELAGEEVATQIQAWADEYQTSNPIPEATADPNGGTGTTANEDPVLKEFSEKIKNLEKKNRMLEFNEYFEKQVSEGKLVPAQRSLVMSALELGHETKKTFNEGNKAISGLDFVKGLIESFPKQVELDEIAKKEYSAQTSKKTNIKVPAKVSVDESSADLDGKIMAFMEEQKTKGRDLTYGQAYSEFVKL